MLVDKLNRGQKSTLAPTQADRALGLYEQMRTTNRLAETIIDFWVAAKHMCSLESPSTVEMDQLKRPQWKAIEMVRRLQHMMYVQGL